MTHKTMLVDDHDIIRFGLRRLVEDHFERILAIEWETDNGLAAVDLASKHQPGLIIMDIGLPGLNGIEATRQIVRLSPATKIIALSIHSDPPTIRDSIQAGVMAYVLKCRVFNDLIDAIRSVLKGECYLSPKIARLVMDDYRGALTQILPTPRHLTGRQIQVLQLIAEGKANKEIAALLGMGIKAVESTRHRIMTKLGIDHVAGLTKYAIQEGLTRTEF